MDLASVRGIGNDIIEVDRIARSLARYGDRFISRVFSPTEQAYCKRYALAARHFAGRFAAKEAVVKALGTGIVAGISWLDIEVLNDAAGKPQVVLSPVLAQRFDHPTILLSISHCHAYATAMAVWIAPGAGRGHRTTTKDNL